MTDNYEEVHQELRVDSLHVIVFKPDLRPSNPPRSKASMHYRMVSLMRESGFVTR